MRARSFKALGGEVQAMLRDLNGFLRDVGIYLLIVILASGGAFIFQNLMAVDEWQAYSDRGGWQTTGPIGAGRPVFAWLSSIAYDAFPLHPFDTVLFYSLLVVFTFTLFRSWTSSSWIRLLLLSLFLTSPLMVEHLHFTVNQIPLSVALLLLTYWFLTIAFTPTSDGRRVLVIASGALAASLAVTIRNELIFLMTGAAIIEFSRAILQGRKDWVVMALELFASFVLTAAISVLLVIGALKVYGTGLTVDGNNGTGNLVATHQQFWDSFDRFVTYIKIFAFKQQYLIPLIVKLLVWLMVIVAVVQAGVARDWRRLAVIVVASVLLSVLPFTLGLLTTGFPYLYAAVFPLALVACFVACLAVTAPRSVPGARAVACIAAALVIAISAANLSSAQVRLSNLNRRDVSTITQMLGAIRATGVEDWRIAMIGSYTDGQPVSWARSREQCSAFQCTQALAPLIILTVLERNPARRIFQLTDAEAAKLKPDLDKLPEGSARLIRLDRNRFVILLK